MSPVRNGQRSRRLTIRSPLLITSALVAGVAGIVVAAWMAGVLNVSFFRSGIRSTAGLVPVPISAIAIPEYTKVTRDHLWDTKNARITVIYLQPKAVPPDTFVNLRDVIGRVLSHNKQPGYTFTETDFLPKGTREGIVGGIPPGKRAIRVQAEKVDGLYGLRPGDRFDLVATLAIDGGRGGGAQGFNVGGVYGQQLALQARLSNWQKQATVRVMVQNGVIVEPMITRQIPVFTNSLTQGGVSRQRPVQEIVIAIDPEEVARLTEAMAVDAKIACIPRSGRPDDPRNSVTPDLSPVSPFTGPGLNTAGVASDADGSDSEPADRRAPFSMVERISGSKRELTAVPRR
jgi:Flp pilus assembly protein CpaB